MISEIDSPVSLQSREQLHNSGSVGEKKRFHWRKHVVARAFCQRIFE